MSTSSAACVVPFGLVTRRRSSAGVSSRVGRVRARAGHGRERQLLGKRRVETELDGGQLQALDQQEHVGRPAARDRGHGVHVPLVIEPGDGSDGGEQLAAQRALAAAHGGVGDERSDPAADGGRRVRHRAHDARIGSEAIADVADCLSRRDRQEHGARARERRAPRQHVRELIRLDRENDDVGRLCGRADVTRCRRRRAAVGGRTRGRHGIHDLNAARGHGPWRASRARAPGPCCRTRSGGSRLWRSTRRSLVRSSRMIADDLARRGASTPRLAFAPTLCHDARRSEGVRSVVERRVHCRCGADGGHEGP